MVNSQEIKIAELEKENLAHQNVVSELEIRIASLEANREQTHSQSRSELNKVEPENEVKLTMKGHSRTVETTVKRILEPKFVRRRRSAVENVVAFSASMTVNQEHQGTGQDMLFNHVITNLGNGYNDHHGTFIAPMTGTYVFYFSLHSSGARADLVVNGAPVANLYVGNTDQASQLAIVNLKNGDDVSVQNLGSDNLYFGSGYSTFSGFLLYEGIDPNQIVG